MDSLRSLCCAFVCACVCVCGRYKDRLIGPRPYSFWLFEGLLRSGLGVGRLLGLGLWPPKRGNHQYGQFSLRATHSWHATPQKIHTHTHTKHVKRGVTIFCWYPADIFAVRNCGCSCSCWRCCCCCFGVASTLFEYVYSFFLLVRDWNAIACICCAAPLVAGLAYDSIHALRFYMVYRNDIEKSSLAVCLNILMNFRRYLHRARCAIETLSFGFNLTFALLDLVWRCQSSAWEALVNFNAELT